MKLDTPEISSMSRATLANGKMWIGGAGNTAAEQAMSGDAAISNTGAVTLAATGVAAGTYGGTSAVPVITVDAKGRATSIGQAIITTPATNLYLYTNFI